MDKILYSKNIKEELDFPKKTLFGKFSPDKLSSRRSKIEAYLNRLSILLNLTNHTEACEFLEIEEQIRVLLQSLEFEIRTNDYTSFSTRKYSEDDSGCALQNRDEGACILDFLTKLNHDPLKIANTVKNFETYYFNHSLSLLESEIKCLLWGINKLQGLLYFCGQDTYFVASNSCIQLFAKFLKFEYNSVEADKFLKVFAQTEVKIVKSMNLGTHRGGVTTMCNNELVILYYYLEKNIYGIRDPSELLNDPKTVTEYNKWIQNKLTCGYLFKKSINMNAIKAKSEEHEDIKTSHLMKENVSNVKLNEQILKSSKEIAMPFIQELQRQIDDYKEWIFVDSLCRDTIRIHSKGTSELRLEIDLMTDNINKAAEYVFNVKKIMKWANVKYKTLAKEDENQDTVQLFYANSSVKTKYIECIKHRQKKVLDNSSIIISEYSLLEAASRSPEITRIHLNSSISTLTEKTDLNGNKYIEWKKLISLKEGYVFSMEYFTYTQKELERMIIRLNKMLTS